MHILFVVFCFCFNQKCLIRQTTFFYNISGSLIWEAILERLSLPWNPMMKIWYEAPVVSNKSHWPLVSTDNRSGNSDVWEDLTRFCRCVALVAFTVPFSDTVSVPHRDFAAVTTNINSAHVSRSTVVSIVSYRIVSCNFNYDTVLMHWPACGVPINTTTDSFNGPLLSPMSNVYMLEMFYFQSHTV